MHLSLSQRVAALQAAIARDPAAEELDGWLIYDFKGLNPYAASLLGLPADAHLSRRYFVYVPRQGQATLLHHRIEGGSWRGLGAGELRCLPYAEHSELDTLLRELVGGKRVALEYSPRAQVPAVSRVDAGTAERLREAGAELRSSADLLQQFLTWDEDDLAAHRQAAEALVAAKDDAWELLRGRLESGESVSEYEVQQFLMQRITAAGLEYGHAPIVAFGAHAGDPHHAPSAEKPRELRVGDCVMIDLWGCLPGKPYADMTFMAHAGAPSPDFISAWEAVRAARNAAVAALRSRSPQAQGWEIDRLARDMIAAAGHGEAFSHRLGHNLGWELHGPGVNLDDFEAHDTRLLLPGLAVTVEPGIYRPEQGFGIRSEVNVFLTPGGAEVTTPEQEELELL